MANQEKLAALRGEYETVGLSRSRMHEDPYEQFALWLDQAIAADVAQPNAVIVATADAHGRPSSRAVLLKDFDHRGFVFFTNLDSRKGRELRTNPRASLCFLWLDLHRQVRIDGSIEYVSDADSDTYFATRPREAQIASAASPQSEPIESREVLQARFEELAEATDHPVRPSRWGGVRVRPQEIEFWQGRLHRLHDRLVYVREGEGWSVHRLAP